MAKMNMAEPKWAGGFDLRISGLTQVTKTESSAHGKNYYDYYADITKYKTGWTDFQTSGEPSVGRDSRHQDRTH